MWGKHPALNAVVTVLNGENTKKQVGEAALDATQDDQKKDEVKEEHILDAAGDYAQTDIAIKAAAAVQEWAETVPEDLDEGEGLGDRLFGLIAGIADADMDGEVSEEEADVMAMAAEAAWDYLAGKGIADEDLDALLNDYDNDVAARVQERVLSELPDGDEASALDIDQFAFGDGSDESVLDDTQVLDAVYKKRLVVRDGKRVRINKRVSGTVRLSAKQKLAIRKAQRKAHSARATARRAKSMKLVRRLAK